jgi:hypothetical protein
LELAARSDKQRVADKSLAEVETLVDTVDKHISLKVKRALWEEKPDQSSNLVF